MSILLAITKEQFSPKELRPFYPFDGKDGEFVTSVDITRQCGDAYQKYVNEWGENQINRFSSYFGVRPYSYEEYLLSEGFYILPLPKMPRDYGDEHIFFYALKNREGEIVSSFERKNSDIYSDDGGLAQGYRIDRSNLALVNHLDDGQDESAAERLRKELNIAVILGDDADVQALIWGAWERRYNAHFCASLNPSFAEWRNNYADGKIKELGAAFAKFCLRQSQEIPPACRSRQEFIKAAIAVTCDAVLYQDKWYEQKNDDSWSEIVRWSTFVNHTLQEAPDDSWVTTIRF